MSRHAANHRLNGNLGADTSAADCFAGLCEHSAVRTRHPLNYWDQCKMKVWRMTRVEKRTKKGETLERTDGEGVTKKMKRRGHVGS